MHLTCTNMPVDKLDNALAEVKKAGLQNILALRGDPPKGQEEFTVVEGGFGNALDLVKYIRCLQGLCRVWGTSSRMRRVGWGVTSSRIRRAGDLQAAAAAVAGHEEHTRFAVVDGSKGTVSDQEALAAARPAASTQSALTASSSKLCTACHALPAAGCQAKANTAQQHNTATPCLPACLLAGSSTATTLASGLPATRRPTPTTLLMTPSR